MLNEQLKQLPMAYLQRQLEVIIVKKAPDAPKEMATALATHLVTSPSDPFEWDDGTDAESSINIDIQDLMPAFEDTHRFMDEEVPGLILKTIAIASTTILKSLKADWPAQRAHDQARVDQFDENLRTVWGGAFDTLRMMYTIAVEIGSQVSTNRRRSRSKRNVALNDTILRMHARACQVTYEIITLIETGLADGAMARWRTLHEITVVASLLVEHGEDLAIRYRTHEAVEAKRAMDRYVDHYEVLGFAPPSKREMKQTQAAYEACLEKYGDRFGSEYGWASHHLGLKKPRFVDLEAAAGKTAMQSFYRMASYNVHAGSKGITFRMGTLEDLNGPALAGVSNVGFVDPAQNAAADLVHMTTLLSDGTTRIDRMIEWQILGLLREELVRKLEKAHRSIERAHKARAAPPKRAAATPRDRESAS